MQMNLVTWNYGCCAGHGKNAEHYFFLEFFVSFFIQKKRKDIKNQNIKNYTTLLKIRKRPLSPLLQNQNLSLPLSKLTSWKDC